MENETQFHFQFHFIDVSLCQYFLSGRQWKRLIFLFRPFNTLKNPDYLELIKQNDGRTANWPEYTSLGLLTHRTNYFFGWNFATLHLDINLIAEKSWINTNSR